MFVGYSVIVAGSKNGAGSLRKHFGNQVEEGTSSQSKTKMGKEFQFIEVANLVISAYCGLGTKPDGNHVSDSCPELFRVIRVAALFYGDPVKNAPDMNDDQNNKDHLNSFGVSKDRLEGLPESYQIPNKS